MRTCPGPGPAHTSVWRRSVALGVVVALLAVLAAPLAGHAHAADPAEHHAVDHDHHGHDHHGASGQHATLDAVAAGPREPPSGVTGEGGHWHWHEVAPAAVGLPVAVPVLPSDAPCKHWDASPLVYAVAVARTSPPYRPPIG